MVYIQPSGTNSHLTQLKLFLPGLSLAFLLFFFLLKHVFTDLKLSTDKKTFCHVLFMFL